MRLHRPAEYTLLVVEGADEEARLLAGALAREGYEVRHATSALMAMDLVTESPPSLCLIDQSLPDASGLELCRRLRADQKLWRMPIVILSSRDAETDRVAGFESGADDFVVKPFSMTELLLRIRARLAEVPALRANGSTNVRRYGELEIYPESFRVLIAGHPIRLSAQEFRLLLALVNAPGEVLSREDLEATWRGKKREARRAVDSHIKRLRRKLGSAAAYIQTIRGAGYRFLPP